MMQSRSHVILGKSQMLVVFHINGSKYTAALVLVGQCCAHTHCYRVAHCQERVTEAMSLSHKRRRMYSSIVSYSPLDKFQMADGLFTKNHGVSPLPGNPLRTETAVFVDPLFTSVSRTITLSRGHGV